jgi:nicotinamidase-related amidase
VTEDPRQAPDGPLADIAELLLRGAPEQVTRALLEGQPARARAEAGKVADVLATLAVALPPEPPAVTPGGVDMLRARVLAAVGLRRPKRSALLVIDMLNDHLTPGSTVEVPRARDIVPALASRLTAARTAHVPVIYVVDQHEADDPDLDQWTTHNVVGSPGADVWPALAPRSGDKMVPKSTYSAFTASALEVVLDDLAVDTLVLTGCLTEMGVMATAMDALQRGFAVEVPKDSQAGSSPVAEAAALDALALMPPFGPARRERLAKVEARLAEAPASGG